MADISTPNPSIQSYAQEWQRNRDVMDGARTIRKRSQTYLPMVPGQSFQNYNSFVNRIPFFPAASRTHDGLIGLMFRKAATVTCPDQYKLLLDTITAAGWDIETLGRKVASELLTTSYGGLLVDAPAAPVGLDRKTAQDGNYRPFIALYQAESVINVTQGVVNNRAVLTQVVLWDDVDTIRELRLDDGVYSVTIHKKSGAGSFVPVDHTIPTRNGKPLAEIPFTLISRDDGVMPVTASLSDICDHNIQCYLAASNLAICHYFSSSPIYNISGSESAAEDFPVYPGAIWVFASKDTEAKVLEYSGKSIDALRLAVQDIKDEMAAIGSRILASDKAVVESADALAIRRASENATLASIARIVSRIINSALDDFAQWIGLDPKSIEFSANTDYNAKTLSDKDIVARMAMWQAGACSLETFQSMMMDGEVLGELFDAELDAQQREQEIADRPTQMLPQPGDQPPAGDIKVVTTATA